MYTLKLSMLGILDTINKSKTHVCECNLLAVILIGNHRYIIGDHRYTREIRK